MTECALCSRTDILYEYPHRIITVIKQATTIKTGFKEYQTKTQWYGQQIHDYVICEKCHKKFGEIIPIIVWGLGGILALLPLFFLKKDDDPLLILFCASPMIFTPFYILMTQFLGLNAKLKKKALKDREAVSGKPAPSTIFELDPRHLRTDRRLVEYEAYTEGQFEKLKQKK